MRYAHPVRVAGLGFAPVHSPGGELVSAGRDLPALSPRSRTSLVAEIMLCLHSIVSVREARDGPAPLPGSPLAKRDSLGLPMIERLVRELVQRLRALAA